VSLKKSKKLLVILLAMAAVAGIGVSYLAAQRALAPAVTFLTLKGERIAMSDLRGKVVLVEFWATDCVTCVREMPQLAATHEKYRTRGYETVAVAMRYDPPNYVAAYAERNRLPFTVAFDPLGEVAKAFGEVKVTPTTFVIDRRGAIVARILGERDFTRLHALIEEKLNDPA
jgi:peroxiredoxin